MENTGEARARKVAEDLLAARLIARAVCERKGNDWRGHPLMGQPVRVVFGKGGEPCFLYARPLRAFSVGGEDMPARMVESLAGGSLVVHRVYSPAGILVHEETTVRGDPTRN
jgi:hypothetical protein